MRDLFALRYSRQLINTTCRPRRLALLTKKITGTGSFPFPFAGVCVPPFTVFCSGLVLSDLVDHEPFSFGLIEVGVFAGEGRAGLGSAPCSDLTELKSIPHDFSSTTSHQLYRSKTHIVSLISVALVTGVCCTLESALINVESIGPSLESGSCR